MSSTFEKLKEIIVDRLGVTPEQVTPEASFQDDLGADSLDFVELLMEIDETFDVEIPESEQQNITTVQAAADYIDRLKSE